MGVGKVGRRRYIQQILWRQAVQNVLSVGCSFRYSFQSSTRLAAGNVIAHVQKTVVRFFWKHRVARKPPMKQDGEVLTNALRHVPRAPKSLAPRRTPSRSRGSLVHIRNSLVPLQNF